jgi:hypothetical protein
VTVKAELTVQAQLLGLYWALVRNTLLDRLSKYVVQTGLVVVGLMHCFFPAGHRAPSLFGGKATAYSRWPKQVGMAQNKRPGALLVPGLDFSGSQHLNTASTSSLLGQTGAPGRDMASGSSSARISA